MEKTAAKRKIAATRTPFQKRDDDDSFIDTAYHMPCGRNKHALRMESVCNTGRRKLELRVCGIAQNIDGERDDGPGQEDDN